MFEDLLLTRSTEEQASLEQRLLQFFEDYNNLPSAEQETCLALLREQHVAYLLKGLTTLPSGYVALEAGRPWICYWILHSLALVDAPVDDDISTGVVAFLRQCQAPSGGFGGGPGQLPHLAPTYAAVLALVTLGGPSALCAVDRPAMAAFLRSMCVPPERGGGLMVCPGGEVDVRGCYTALAVAHVLGLDKADLCARSGLIAYVRRCQTHEGGLGGEPGNEAHGGYTFCGLAALVLAGRPDVLDLPALTRWAAWRQGTLEGGFMGRTNKLVDGCYSFWQGGLFSLLRRISPGLARSPGAPAPQPGGPLDASTAHPPTGAPTVERQGIAANGASQAVEPGANPAAALRVPPLPDLEAVAGPAEHAHWAAASAQARAAGAVDTALEGRGAQSEELLSAAGDAQAAAQRAERFAHIARASVAALDLTVKSPGGTYCAADSCWPALPAPRHGAQPTSTGDAARMPDLYNAQALQFWVLRCCQASRGGLRDKPGKPPDYYHTCYCLSGLASAQHYSGVVVGPPANRLQRADELCNVEVGRLRAARAFYGC